MVELVQDIDIFVSLEEFSAADGSELAVARFESTEAINAWHEQPDHVRTRERGREEFVAAYDITIADLAQAIRVVARQPVVITRGGTRQRGSRGAANRHGRAGDQ